LATTNKTKLQPQKEQKKKKKNSQTNIPSSSIIAAGVSSVLTASTLDVPVSKGSKSSAIIIVFCLEERVAGSDG
jgi:hypothetical protein